MTFLRRRRLRGCLVTVYRTNGKTARGIVVRYTRAGIRLRKVELELDGNQGYAQLTSEYILIDGRHFDMVGVEVESVA